MPKLDVWQPKSNADAVAESRGRSRTIPRRKCKNHALRKKLEADPPEWLKYFFPARFSLPWASYHLDIIHDSLYAIRHGTNQLNIAPRGGGKSRPVMGVILLAGLSGISPFPVYAPWKSEAVDQAFRFWIAALAHNKRLADLYPEFCDPFRIAKGAPQRMSSLVWDDKDKDPTGARLAVSDGLIILPDSRGIIGSTTINGNPLGMAYDAPNGTTIRPTIVFIDDPEDDKVAESETLTKKIIRKIDADFGGMGGPDKKMAMIMCGTVKSRTDVVTHYRNNPEWNVKITPRITAWPEGWDSDVCPARKVWEEFADVRRDGLAAKDKGASAIAFYEAHKDAMTKGMRVSWPERYDPSKGEPDALYSAIWDYYHMGLAGFMAENQGEPIEEGVGDMPYKLTPDIICSRCADRDPFAVPEWVGSVVYSTDINPSYALTSAVVGFGRDQTAAVIWYGLFTGEPLPIKNDMPQQERARKVFEALAIHGKQLATMKTRADFWAVDASGEYFDTIMRFCAESVRLCGVQAIPCTGASGKSYRPYGKNVLGQPREGCHMRSDVIDGRRRKWMSWDADHWREIAQRAWLGSVGAPGSISLFRGRHTEFAGQICAEKLMGKAYVGGALMYNWHTAPGAHDYGDVLAQAYAAAAWGGIGTSGGVAPRQQQRRRATGCTVIPL